MRILLFLFLLPIQVFAQPGVDIWVGDFDVKTFEVMGLENLTNRPGYDNQPYFLPDGSGFLFSSDRNGKDTDLFRFDFESGKSNQISNSPASEFSPQLIPGKRGYSTVRIDPDEWQRFWILDENGEEVEALFGLENVGYNSWFNEDEVFFFLVGAEEEGGHQLAWGMVSKNKIKAVDRGIGRSIVSSENELYYSRKNGSGELNIIRLTPTDKMGKFESSMIGTMPKGAEDFEVLNGKFIFTSQNNQFMVLDLQSTEKGWNRLGEVSPGNEKQVSRIAIDAKNGKIAFVIAE